MKTLFILLILSSSMVLAADAREETLLQQLKTLEIENQAPAGVSQEQLYVVQDRFLSLKYKSEVSIGVAQNYTGDSFLTIRQFELGYRFHFNNRWSTAYDYTFVSNQFTESAKQLFNNEAIIPDVSYAKSRMGLLASFNAFYGKFRWSMNRVLYFDQYFSLGPGLMELNTGNAWAGVADIGLVFWVEKFGSVRLGVKDYVYTEKRQSGTTTAQNIHAHLNLGYVF